jgi:hypothetical protein
MTYDELKGAAQRLADAFPDEDNVSLGNMLAICDCWRNSQSWYIQLFIDLKA